MKKIVIASLLALSVNANAGTNGHIELQNQSVPANQNVNVWADYKSQYQYNGHGCHTATIKMYLDVAHIHQETKMDKEICPGLTRVKYRLNVNGNFEKGTYPIHATMVLSALGQNPTKTADAILTVN